mgnify:CR=1 FL=1
MLTQQQQVSILEGTPIFRRSELQQVGNGMEIILTDVFGLTERMPCPPEVQKECSFMGFKGLVDYVSTLR